MPNCNRWGERRKELTQQVVEIGAEIYSGYIIGVGESVVHGSDRVDLMLKIRKIHRFVEGPAFHADQGRNYGEVVFQTVVALPHEKVLHREGVLNELLRLLLFRHVQDSTDYSVKLSLTGNPKEPARLD